MFDAYELTTHAPDVKRLTVAGGVALAVLFGLAMGVSALASRAEHAPVEKKVDVSFRPPPPPPAPVKIERPPPPPPKPKAPPPPVPVVEVAAPAPMVAPKEIPKEVAPESDVAVAAKVVAVGGTGSGVMGAAVGGEGDESAAPVVAAGPSSGPINLPEDADPPEPSEDNAQPEYPESARASGQEARVVLKVVVTLDGRIGAVQVLKGEEPFLAAALAAVKTWTYAPAQLEGRPIAVFKIIDLKFRLRE